MGSEDQMKCICCDREQEVLVSVEMKNTSIFGYRRGVCRECLKIKDINKICIEFEIRKTKESIKDSEVAIDGLKDHLKKLDDAVEVESEQ